MDWSDRSFYPNFLAYGYVPNVEKIRLPEKEKRIGGEGGENTFTICLKYEVSRNHSNF